MSRRDEHCRNRGHGGSSSDDAGLREGDVSLQRVGDLAESRVSRNARVSGDVRHFPETYASGILGGEVDVAVSPIATRPDVEPRIRSLARNSSASSSSGTEHAYPDHRAAL